MAALTRCVVVVCVISRTMSGAEPGAEVEAERMLA